MKSIKILIHIGLIVAALLCNSCNSLLEEHPQSQVVPSFFSSPSGLLGGIAGVYNDLRSSIGTEGYTINNMAGTDEHLMGASAQNPSTFTYNGIQANSFSGSFNIYTSINTLNGILQFGQTANLDNATRKQYLAQAKFLRGYIYFYLVQTFGEVPLHTTFITAPSQADSRASVEDVYALIIKDLTEASVELPEKPTAPFLGKAATQSAARYFLAKAYLTRGWLLNSDEDFALAYTWANDSLIAKKSAFGIDLWQDYADAFKPANDYGKETLFVSDHSSDPKFGLYTPGAAGGAAQNVAPWMGLFNGPSLGANSTVNASGKINSAGPVMLFRDVFLGRPFSRIRPNVDKITVGPNLGKSYIYDQAFTNRKNDSRYEKTFQTVWLANLANSRAAYSGNGTTSSRGTLTCAKDTAIWFPDYEVAGAPQAFGARSFKGIIVTPNMQTNTIYPYMKKLADPNRAAPNDPSTRPVVVARFADAYLIAAEAAFKRNDKVNAAAMLNVLRKRAAFRTNNIITSSTTTINDKYAPGETQASAEASMMISPDQVTLDFILDERTRELYGEGYRWLDLVRTKSLVNRVKAWNPIEAGTYIQETNALRPIPQDQIDRVTVGEKFPQNPGY